MYIRVYVFVYMYSAYVYRYVWGRVPGVGPLRQYRATRGRVRGAGPAEYPRKSAEVKTGIGTDFEQQGSSSGIGAAKNLRSPISFCSSFP